MKKQLTAIVLAAAALVLVSSAALPAFGQGAAAAAGDLASLVSALVERFPADNAASRDALCAELVRLGPAGLAEAFSRVLPPGAGNDAKARFAANGLAVYVTRAGAEAERRMLDQALLAALVKASDKQVASFLISQVQIAGRAESIKPLSAYLRDDALAGPAVAALQTIGGAEAAKALAKNLGAAPRAAKLAIVDALGAMRSREAVKKLLPLAGSNDEGLRRAARFALANIGDPAAGPVLAQVPVAASLDERTEAPGRYLLFARRLAESGRSSDALEAARSILDSHASPGESQVAAEALSLVVSLLKDGAVPDLLRAVDSPAPAVRGAALEMAAAVGTGETTSQWIDKASSSGPEVRAGIVGMLGRRGDRSALPFVRESLQSRDAAVRLAAVPAAVRLGGETVLPDLFGLVAGADERTAAALETALLGYDGRRVVPAAVDLLDTTPLPGRALLVDLLGEKGAREEIDRIFVLAADPEPATRAAALQALAKLAREADLPRLVAMLEQATDAEDVVHLQDAVAAAALRDAEPARRGAALVDLMKDAPAARKAVILRVFPKVGSGPALRAVIAETEAADPQVQTAAVYALSQWPDGQATGDLLRIATTTGSKRFRLLAVDGYVRLIGRANMPGPRKLALFQELLAAPFDDADKKAILTGASSIREPEALRLLASYLDNQALGETAAAGLLDLASEQAPQERWLSGHEAYSVLRHVQARAAADPAEYERIGALVAERLRQGGFVPLFDGRTLAGWKGLVADPPARAKMTPQELAAAQAAADDRMRAHWKVADGALVFDGHGESLCTVSDYGDFELLADWKIEKGGDSGLYLRGSPQVQIWDPDGNPAGSGGLYNNQKGKSQPLERADRPVGEWNAFRVIMIGDRVSVYLNDKMVVDNVVLENYWERDKPIYPTGQIELQAHGNPLRFRNVFIREIPRDGAAPTMSPAEADEGFTPLFNGRDLEGWTGDTKGYAAENGKIVIHPELGSGNLYTVKEYADFVVRFEFKLTPAANNGLGVRAPLEGDAAYVGMEIQILEDGSPVYWGLRPYQYHGSIYGVVPARRGFLRPPGEWNAEEVTVQGRHVTVVVNGSTIIDADLDQASAGGTIDHNEHPGLARATGHIGFLGHGSLVEFRNIRVKESR
jgi:HEAT repeat protein